MASDRGELSAVAPTKSSLLPVPSRTPTSAKRGHGADEVSRSATPTSFDFTRSVVCCGGLADLAPLEHNITIKVSKHVAKTIQVLSTSGNPD